MSSKLILYYSLGSPSSRACLLLAHYLKLDIEVKHVDIPAGEQNTEEFVKLNPLKKVPVLVDGDFVVSESRAILAYLVNSRAPGSCLYPKDPKQRALVDQILYMDATVLYPTLDGHIQPIIKDRLREVSQASKESVRDVLRSFDKLLDGKLFFAGDNLTIADFSILTLITSFYEMVADLSEFTCLNQWFLSLQNLPKFAENRKGAILLAGLLNGLVDGSIF